MRKKTGKKTILGKILLALLLISLICVALVFILSRHYGFDLFSSGPASPVTEQAVPLQGIIRPQPDKLPESESNIVVSELMPSNKCTLPDESGSFPDWIEFYNAGDQNADLSKCSLRCNGDSIALDAVTMAPGEYYVMFCPGELSASGATVVFKNNRGKELTNITYGPVGRDISVRVSEEGISTTAFPSPGQPNSDEGYDRWQSSLQAGGPLVINEVMVHNSSYLRISNNYYDWVEIRNNSEESVLLSDYYLSDGGSDRLRFRLPPKTLAPGKLYILYFSDEEASVNQDFAPFGLNALRDELFLSSADGKLCDFMPLHDIPLNGSAGKLPGKNGTFYFTTPTPQAENKGGYRCIAAKPVALEKDGVFNDVSSVTVTLSAPGTIYFTTNGSRPTTDSTVYTGPITLTSTTVVRAISYEPGKLTAEPLSLSYIINEGHSLPVVSLVADPADFTAVYGRPTVENERPAVLEYFGEDGSFAMDCGFKLHGATSKIAQQKKSMKIQFKNRYAGPLEYDLFGNGVTEFSSVLLRAAQEDVYSTLMRDNLMHQLSLQAFPELSVQDYRYAVLYVNGQYWGLYNFREAHSPEHFANHHGLETSDVTMYRELAGGDCPQLNEIYRTLAYNTDYSNAKYEEICSKLDVDSVIAWCIIQAYSGNYDIHPTNVRFYYVASEDKLYYSLSDLDLGFFDPWTFQFVFDMNGDYAYIYNRVAKLLLNFPQFRKQFSDALAGALSGPLSNENVLSLIDSLADQIRPEIYADRVRWGGTVDGWEKMVGSMKYFVTAESGRARTLVFGIKRYIAVNDADFVQVK